MDNYLTYLYLLTPLHTGGSANEGNLMGIAREVHTEFPYLPASSLRGKIRSEIESTENEVEKKAAGRLFGEKILNGSQPTQGAIWFADATLLFFPIASLSHHLIWITCPMWLERWNRWLPKQEISGLIKKSRKILKEKSAIASFETDKVYLQTALLKKSSLGKMQADEWNIVFKYLENLVEGSTLLTLLRNKLLILTDEDCAALVELGLQREVRVTLEEDTKTVKGGSFRSQEAIPPEAVLFFSWGMKTLKKSGSEEVNEDVEIRKVTHEKLNKRLQFGGLEGLGRGISELRTIKL
ncbi:MAG: type III-B CRISPR module RAMP protein Cmr4 [Rivularia sp. (in: Bacteria)]|nr:type III-B CRISPR module RAMP protein Cmr4 [Rivularia sp. MS3]